MSYLSSNRDVETEIYEALKRRDQSALDEILQFLQDDPRMFRSGYVKQRIWHSIKRFSLEPSHIQRLEQAALKYLQRPMSTEFSYMCKAMVSLGTPEFWRLVAEKRENGTPRERINAGCLLPYSQGIEAGIKVFQAYKKMRDERALNYTYANVHLFDAHTPEKLMKLLHEPEYWPQGNVLQRAETPDDLPIVYYMARGREDGGIDKEFARLNIRAANVDRLLPKLEEILITGWYISYTTTTWLYIIYLMQQMNDVRVVPILITFLQKRVDYKFEKYNQEPSDAQCSQGPALLCDARSTCCC